MDKMDFASEIKLLAGDGGTGTVEGYASVFGLLDRGGDIMMPGAFKKSIAEWNRKKKPVPMLWQHNSGDPIGIWTDIKEDDHGLRAKGRLIMDVPKAAEARALIKGGAVSGLSIGYRTRESDIDRTTGVRKLKQVELWEVSLVTFPMLPEAQVSDVKNSGGFDPKSWEQAFREEGLSHSEAKLATSVARKMSLRDGEKTALTHRDGAADVLMELRKAAQRMRS